MQEQQISRGAAQAVLRGPSWDDGNGMEVSG